VNPEDGLRLAGIFREIPNFLDHSEKDPLSERNLYPESRFDLHSLGHKVIEAGRTRNGKEDKSDQPTPLRRRY
jgi:hypothetical protein